MVIRSAAKAKLYGRPCMDTIMVFSCVCPPPPPLPALS